MEVNDAELMKIITTLQTQFCRNKYIPSFTDEDLKQEIAIIILEALPKYDKNHKSQKPLIHFLRTVVMNRMRNLVRDRFTGHKPKNAEQESSQAVKKDIAAPIQLSVLKNFDRENGNHDPAKLMEKELVQFLAVSLKEPYNRLFSDFLAGENLSGPARKSLRSEIERILEGRRS